MSFVYFYKNINNVFTSMVVTCEYFLITSCVLHAILYELYLSTCGSILRPFCISQPYLTYA